LRINPKPRNGIPNLWLYIALVVSKVQKQATAIQTLEGTNILLGIC